MHHASFTKITIVILCFFSVALAVQAQNPPVFAPGPQITELSPAFRVLSADVNNDGFADLIAVESSSTSSSIVIYLSNGDGTFRAPFSVFDAANLYDFAIGDFNQDGNLDLAVVSNTTSIFDPTGKGTVTVIFGNGQGGFGSPQTFQFPGTVSGVAAGDFNNDGRMDLAVLSVFSKTITILTNTGSGFTSSSFTIPTNFDTTNPGFNPDFLTSIVAGDFNGDGKMDLIYQDSCGDQGCGGRQEVYYLLTNNGSRFTPALLPMSSTGANSLHVADLDGDARADFYFSYHGCGHTVCFGVIAAYSNGDGTFQEVQVFNGDTSIAGGAPGEVIAGDFNNDGIMDIAAASDAPLAGGSPGLDIYLGKGGRSGFATPIHFDSPNGVNATPARIAAGFFNHDGSKDILLVENGDFKHGDFIPFMNQTSTAQDPCPYPADPGINFCLPAIAGTGASTSPVRFVGSFHAQTQPANRIELWIDNQKQLQVFGDRIDISVPVSTGIHIATLVGVSATGQFIKSTRSFTVLKGPCAVPTSPSVSICTPVPGSTVGSPTHIAASAAPPAGRTITAMRIYIDNQAELTVNGNTISDDIALPSGNHLLVVVAWDNTGASQTKSENFNVVGGTAPCLPTDPAVSSERVCTPAQNSTVDSPVEVSAGATMQHITAARVYVDNVVAYFAANSSASSSFSIDVGLTMAAGNHQLAIVFYENDGSAAVAFVNITVR